MKKRTPLERITAHLDWASVQLGRALDLVTDPNFAGNRYYRCKQARTHLRVSSRELEAAMKLALKLGCGSNSYLRDRLDRVKEHWTKAAEVVRRNCS